MRKVCEANQAGSFEKASRLLESLAGLHISAKRAQLITEKVGALLIEQRDQATRAFLARERDGTAIPAAVALMVVTADGGRVQTRQDDPTQRWKEDKIGVVYDALAGAPDRDTQRRGARPVTRSLVATMDTWEALGEHLSALADRRGYAHAREKLFIADGAAAIRSLYERCFPDATFILDWAHAAGHLHDCAVAAFGPGEEANAWFDLQKKRLMNGRADRVRSELRRQSREHGPPPRRAADNDHRRILANNVEYFQRNRDAMDYATFRERGWPIGSGIVESAVKQIGKRVKGTEKHWSAQGVEAVLQVVAHVISEDQAWQAFWQTGPFSAAA